MISKWSALFVFMLSCLSVSCSLLLTPDSKESQKEPSIFKLDHQGPLLFEAPFTWEAGEYDTSFDLIYRVLGENDWDTINPMYQNYGRIRNLSPQEHYEVVLVAYNDNFDQVKSDTISIYTSPFNNFKKISSQTLQIGNALGEEDEKTPFEDSVSLFWIQEREIKVFEWDSISTWNKLYDCGSCSANRIDWYEAIVMANEWSKHHGLDTVYSYLSQIVNGQIQLDSVVGDSTIVGFRIPYEREWELVADNKKQNQIWDSLDDSQIIGARDSLPTELNINSNQYGVFEIYGSLWEWTYDGYQSYPMDEVRFFVGINESKKVLRGGSWRETDPTYFSSSNRLSQAPNDGNVTTGMRLVLQNYPQAY